MNRTHFTLLVLTLIGVGLVLFLYKLIELRYPLSPRATTTEWELEASVSFVAKNQPVKVALFIPRSLERITILDEHFISRGFGLTSAVKGGNRQAAWFARQERGLHTLFYHAVIQRYQSEAALVEETPIIEPPALEGAHLESATVLLQEAKERSADTDTLATALLQALSSTAPSQHVALLLGKKPSTTKRFEVAVKVLALAGIPARTVHGIRLEEGNRHAPILHWLEVFNAGRWQAYDPSTSAQGLPREYIPWWRGDEPLAKISGGERLSVNLAIAKNEEVGVEHAVLASKERHSNFFDFSLFSLPLRTQAVFRIMLLIPLGALLVVLLRNVIGIDTFGTFMPVLVALAFRETELIKGVILFCLVVSLGLAARFYLEHLKLLLVPRLAAVLTVVVLLLAALSVLTNKMGLDAGFSLALFPMVILTMTIERMSIVWEELGPATALKQAGGSLLAAVLACLLMTWSLLEHLIFVFPELLLIVLALNILLGRYTGYRLLELKRFKVLAKQ